MNMRFLQTTLIGMFALLTVANAQNYADESVLSNGQWYKLGVVQDGIYKLDRSFFTGIGVNPDNIDPRNIRIYGNGGAILPQQNSAFRHDDLVEMRFMLLVKMMVLLTRMTMCISMANLLIPGPMVMKLSVLSMIFICMLTRISIFYKSLMIRVKESK